MARAGRALQYTLLGVAIALLVVIVGVLLLTRTTAGVERAGQFAVERLRASLNGELEVGAVRSRGLLRGVTLEAVRITGPDGRLFLQADSARLAYHLRSLARGDMALDRLTLYRPEIHLELLPGRDEWNFQAIFPDDPDRPEDNLVLITDATVHDGYVAIRLPVDPAAPPSARAVTESVPGGTVRTVRFSELNARFPRIVWQAPDADGRLVRIQQLSGQAWVWDAPARIRELEGTVTLRDSVITFRAPRVRLPDSELSALGQLVLGENGYVYDIEAEGTGLRFRDFQWLYPGLPDEGGGGLRFRVQTREPGSVLWLARDARLATPGTELSGSFGIVTGDTLYFTNVDLRAAPLDLDLLRRILPIDLPVDGLLIGTVEVDGPLSALRTRGDLRYQNLAGGPNGESAVRWAGTFQTARPWTVQGLDAEIRSLDLAQVAAFVPDLRLRGAATGRLRLDGALESGMRVRGRLALDQAGRLSAVEGDGRVQVAPGRSDVDVRFTAEPVALELLAEQYPGLRRVVGDARGPIHVAGSLEDMVVQGALTTPAGDVALDGRFTLVGSTPRFRAEGSVSEFRLDRVVGGIPETVVTARFDLDGAGRTAADVEGRVAIDLGGGRVAGIEVLGGALRGSIADGLARVDTLVVSGVAADVRGSGSFGLVAGRDGTLDVIARAESLTFLEPVLFALPGGAANPSTNGAAAMFADPRVGGRVTVEGALTGSIAEWSARGVAEVRELVYDEFRLQHADIRGDWRDGAAELAAVVDSLQAGHRRLTRARSSIRFMDGGGEASLQAQGIGAQALDLAGDFAVVGNAIALTLDRVALATGESAWDLTEPTRARIGRDGITVDSLLLQRAPGRGAIRVDGVLPWRLPDDEGPRLATMEVVLDHVSIGEALRVSQTDTVMDGFVSGTLRVTGTALDPVMDGEVGVRPFRLGGAVMDSTVGSFQYADRLLAARLDGWRAGTRIVEAHARVPVELALTASPDRLLDGPADLRLRADGLPASLVAFLAPPLRQVGGTIDGAVELALGGGPVVLGGELRLSDGAALVEPLNVRYRDIEVMARMGDGSRVHIEATGRTDQGAAAARGYIDLITPRDPLFNLSGTARRLDASRRRDVTAVADGEVHLGGRYTRPVVQGNVRLITADLNIDEMTRMQQVVRLDPSLFERFDTATVAYRPVARSPFIRNIVLDGLVLNAERNVWLRSRELNVEVAGSLDMALDRRESDLRFTGTLQALRGTYQLQLLERLQARRFDIRTGTIEFVGTPGIDPNLDIEGGHRIRRAQGDPLDVVASVSGTLQRPRVRLSSDSDPPMSETDLASFLLFGRSTLELTQAETDVVASMGEGMLGLARPMVLSLASAQLQQAAANLGIPVDYLALTAPEYGFGEYYQAMSAYGRLGVLQGTQLEAGFYAHRNVFFVGSFTPFARGIGIADTPTLFQPGWGARVEVRLSPTWTLEGYWEDRFARTPSFSFDEIHDRNVRGLSVFRDWGY